MALRKALLRVAASVLPLLPACGGIVLPLPEEEVIDLVERLAAGREATDATVATDLLELHQIVLDEFKGAYEPIPESEMVPYNPFLEDKDYEGIDALRWGLGLPAHAENKKSVGAFVVRPVSATYAAVVPLWVAGDWEAIFAKNFRVYERTFEAGVDAAFLDGTSDRVEADNLIEYAAPKDIVFRYESHSVFRRIVDDRLPGGEALIHWEAMKDEAERIEGGYNAYLKFLRNLHVAMKLTTKLSWRFQASWSVAGGSLAFFSAGNTSGDVAEGIRKDFQDFEAYLASD